MVTKKTGKPRGAPKKSFFEDNDRYIIAMGHALCVHYKLGEREAMIHAVRHMQGKREGAENRSDYLLRKWRLRGDAREGYPPKEARWFQHMMMASVTPFAVVSQGTGEYLIRDCCGKAGEDGYGERLIRLLQHRFAGDARGQVKALRALLPD